MIQRKTMQDVPIINHPDQLAEGQLGRDQQKRVFVGLANNQYIQISGAFLESKNDGENLDVSGLAGVLRVVNKKIFGGSTTTHVPEGTNLYFTDARVYTKVKAALVAGSNITITADDTAQTLTIAGTGTGVGADWIARRRAWVGV